jgi:hypothetical protein
MSKSEDLVKQKLSDFAEQMYEKPFGKLGNIEHSNNLCRLFVEQILPELGHSDVVDLFDYGLCDGSGDLVIDALIKVGNNVHIIQSKFVGFNNSFKREYIDSFQGILNRLANPSFDKHKNKRLDELLGDVDWHKDNFFFWLVTNVKFDNQSSAAIENEISLPESFIKKFDLSSDRVNFEYFDQNKLYEVFVSKSVSDERQGAEIVEIFSAKHDGSKRSDFVEIVEENYKSVIFAIESEQIAQVWRKYRNKLFDYNIRNYLGENKKNKAILATAKNEPDKFFLFNNGISAICEELEVDRSKHKITAKKFSVINGAQTVRTLAKLSEQASQPKIMLRVTEIPHHKERNNFLHEVVRFNNTQNEIKSADFRSNDGVQNSIKLSFEKYILKGGKKYEYFPKRLESTKKNIHEVRMTDFGRSVFDFMFNPFEVAGSGASIIFDLSRPSIDNSYYEQIFGPENSSISESDFKHKAGIYFIGLMLDKWLKQERILLKKISDEESTLSLNAIERKPILMMFIRLTLQRLEGELPNKFSTHKFLIDLSNSKKELSISNSDDHHINFLLKIFETVKMFAIHEYQRRKDEGMNHRSWIRGTDQLDKKLEKSLLSFPNLTLDLKNYLLSH